MNGPAKRRNLGRGLDALLGGGTDVPDHRRDSGAQSEAPDGGPAPRTIPIGQIRPGKYQPRRKFDQEDLAALTNSVREKGVLQPILVRPHPDELGAFELIAGERRWLAAQNAGLDDIPVLVRPFDDRETLEIALVENIQRQDLTALEEAEGFRRLINEFGHTQEDLAKVIGCSRSHIANTLRLLTLPDSVKAHLTDGWLSAGHARALLGASDPDALAQRIIDKGLSVRDAERLAQDTPKKPRSDAPRAAREKDVDTLALEHELSGVLGLAVDIQHKGETGAMTLHYKSLEQLDDLLSRLGRKH
jgi:ParB family chromosome partitioning protein